MFLYVFENSILSVFVIQIVSFLFVRALTIAVVIVIPADGPSFGTAPSGKSIDNLQ